MKPKTKRQSRAHSIFIAILGLTVFVSLFLAVVVASNWSAFVSELNYAFNPPTPKPSPTATPVSTAIPQPIVEAPRIIIDKIGVDAPITWNVPADVTTDYLDKGVAHMSGTASLGEVGNLFISGHSSDYSWKKNPYAAVFALLPKLTSGDKITVRENGLAFTYMVVSTKIVDPSDVEIVNQTPNPVLTLMTCYPIGTTQDRYVVKATLVSSPIKLIQKNYDLSVAPEIKFR